MADIDALAPLIASNRQCYEHPTDLAAARAFVAERLSQDEIFLVVAEQNGRAVGFTQLYPSFTSTLLAPIYVLNDLFVDPNIRKMGVGTKLLDAAADFARSVGAVRLTLSTATTNTTAQSVYEQNGWKRDERFYVYHRVLA